MPSLQRSLLASLLGVDLDGYIKLSVIFFLCADVMIFAYYAATALRTKRPYVTVRAHTPIPKRVHRLILLSHILSAQVMIICGALALTVFPQGTDMSSSAIDIRNTMSDVVSDVGHILATTTALASGAIHVPTSIILSFYVPGISTTPGYICVSLLSLHYTARVLREPYTSMPALFALFCILHIYAFVRAIMLIDHCIGHFPIAYGHRYALGVWGATAIVWFVWLDPRVAPPVLIASLLATAVFPAPPIVHELCNPEVKFVISENGFSKLEAVTEGSEVDDNALLGDLKSNSGS